MRKLLLIAALAVATAAWAQNSSMQQDQQSDQNFNRSQQSTQGFSEQRGGEDWYNRVLGAQVDQLARINETVAPSQTAFLEQPENLNGGQPSAIASNAGGQDWYGQKVAAEAEMNGRDLSALRSQEALNASPQ